uniref:Actin-related protein 2/3 complex subunit 5 n=1 Tax=Aceria tosichella TaxID=561515 RepID=A0A6G1SLM6_9ACAR
MTLPQSDVSSLIQANRYSDALKLVIKHSVNVGRKHPLRDQAASLVLQVILNVRSSEIESVVNTLDLDEIDILMRYIYYGFEHPVEGSSPHLLTWHDKACNRGGVGSIVRVLTEH